MTNRPHFFLFSESRNSLRENRNTGEWRFVLESVDGSGKLEVVDQEPLVSGERLELLAVVRGLEALDQPSRVTLITPSRYVSRGLRHGIQQWRETDWQWERFGQMAPIKNDDLWRRVDQAMFYHQVECRYWRFDPSHEEGERTLDVPEEAAPSPTGKSSVWSSLSRVLTAWRGSGSPQKASPSPKTSPRVVPRPLGLFTDSARKNKSRNQRSAQAAESKNA